MERRHVIAIGGKGFARADETPVFETYILKQISSARSRAIAEGRRAKGKPRILFIGTATGDSVAYIARFYETFSRLDCCPSHLPLFERTPDLRKVILSQDAIFVGGGNTKSMLAVWCDWGIDKLLREAWEKGVVMSGVSAGAICWFEEGSTDSWAKELKPLKCLGFIKGSCCPHWSGEKDRKPSFMKMLKAKKIGPGIAIDDAAAVHFVNDRFHNVIAAKKAAHAYAVKVRGKSVTERKL